MASISKPVTFPVFNTEKKMTVVYYNDSCIPRGVKAFFRLDYRRNGQIKMRIKDDKRVLSQSQIQMIRGEMHKIADRYNYNWDELIEAAKRSGT